MNKRPFGDQEIQNVENWTKEHSVMSKQVADSNHESANLMLLLKYPASLRNLLFISLCWMSLSMAYFGLAFNIPTFGLDVMLIFILPTVFTPVIFLNPFLENTFGRKTMLFLSLLLTSHHNTNTKRSFPLQLANHCSELHRICFQW